MTGQQMRQREREKRMEKRVRRETAVINGVCLWAMLLIPLMTFMVFCEYGFLKAALTAAWICVIPSAIYGAITYIRG